MDIDWSPPSPGQWALDKSHFPGGVTPWSRALMEEGCPNGMRRAFKEAGIPLDTIDVRFVNGFMYSRLRGLLGDGKPPKRLPPKPILKLATRLHPEMRRRNAQSLRTFAERPWRATANAWYERDRGVIESQNGALASVDVGTLDDRALIGHIGAIFEHARTTCELHFYLHGHDLGPIAMLLHDARRWGLTTTDVLPLLEGASPSTSEPSRLLRRLRDAVEREAVQPTTLAEVRELGPEAAADLDAYLAMRSCLLVTRYDITGVTLGELPNVVLATIKSARVHDNADDVAARTAAVRERVPEGDRAEFDMLLSDARHVMDMRDDNGPVTWETPLGILRLALLELGRRLASAGRLPDAELAFEVTPAELTGAMSFEALPGAAELDRRRSARSSLAALPSPRLLGADEPQPSPDVLPTGLARVTGMLQLAMAELGMDGRGPTTGLRGYGVGTTVYRGRARRATTPEAAIDSLEPGDVLVVPLTAPSYNVVLTLVGALVTAEGGPMSHAAVLSRELGIPAVIGAPGAMVEIPDGAIIDVDPVAGEVRVVDMASA